jgi:hypothetical protein
VTVERIDYQAQPSGDGSQLIRGQGAQQMQDAHAPDVSTLDGSEHPAGREVPADRP